MTENVTQLPVIAPNTNAVAYRASTDAAGLCREIVTKTATKIQNRKYVCIEGWQAIATAHGCVLSADQVERVTDEGMSGFRAIGIVRRMSDGAELARAEGFLGDDEQVWAKRPVYARRAMVQTRAMSRAGRSAFAHVVVLIDANLSTTPAEEVPAGGFDDEPRPMRNVTASPSPSGKRPSAAQCNRAGLFRQIEANARTCKNENELDAWWAQDEAEIKQNAPASWDDAITDLVENVRNDLVEGKNADFRERLSRDMAGDDSDVSVEIEPRTYIDIGEP